MIKVDVGEHFSIIATLVDEDSMGTGLSVAYGIKNSSGTIVDSGTLIEDTTYSGVYSKNISLSSSGNYIAFYEAVDYARGAENIVVVEEPLARLIKQVRHWNMATENVLAAVDIPSRNVAIGKTDYIIIKIKDDDDSDWSSPIREERYMHGIKL